MRQNRLPMMIRSRKRRRQLKAGDITPIGTVEAGWRSIHQARGWRSEETADGWRADQLATGWRSKE